MNINWSWNRAMARLTCSTSNKRGLWRNNPIDLAGTYANIFVCTSIVVNNKKIKRQKCLRDTIKVNTICIDIRSIRVHVCRTWSGLWAVLSQHIVLNKDFFYCRTLKFPKTSVWNFCNGMRTTWINSSIVHSTVDEDVSPSATLMAVLILVTSATFAVHSKLQPIAPLKRWS